MKEILGFSTSKLKRIISLKTKIERLQAQLNNLAGKVSAAPVHKRRKMSAAARKKISQAQKARWAKQKNSK